MGAPQRQQPVRPSLGSRQARHIVGYPGADLVTDATFPPDARDLCGARPAEVLDDFGADHDLARLDAAARFVDRPGAGPVRRQHGGGTADLAGGE